MAWRDTHPLRKRGSRPVGWQACAPTGWMLSIPAVSGGARAGRADRCGCRCTRGQYRCIMRVLQAWAACGTRTKAESALSVRCCKISGRQEGCRHHPQGTVCLRPAAYKRPIMATGLAGGLTKPYKGIRPAAPMRPGLPAHAPVPLDAAQSSPLPQFFLNTPPFDGKGFDGPGHSYKLSGSPPEAGPLHNKGRRERILPSPWFSSNSMGRG